MLAAAVGIAIANSVGGLEDVEFVAAHLVEEAPPGRLPGRHPINPGPLAVEVPALEPQLALDLGLGLLLVRQHKQHSLLVLEVLAVVQPRGLSREL